MHHSFDGVHQVRELGKMFPAAFLLIGILIFLVGRRQYPVADFGLFRARFEAFSSSLQTFRPGFCDRDAL